MISNRELCEVARQKRKVVMASQGEAWFTWENVSDHCARFKMSYETDSILKQV
jgi:hypothetical protein